MKSMEIWANMPVSNVEKTRSFFRQLGFKDNGPNQSQELASFIFSEGHFVIHFWESSRLTDVARADTSTGSEIIFTLSAESHAAVDQWHQNVVEAGGRVVTAPSEIAEGYNFVFADLDGHRWNVFWCKPEA